MKNRFYTQNLFLSAFLLAKGTLTFIDVEPMENNWRRVLFVFDDPANIADKEELALGSGESLPAQKLFSAYKFLKNRMEKILDEQQILRFGF